MKKHVELFTDGACSGNPGPGGWGAILRFGTHEKELSGGEADTTNKNLTWSMQNSAFAELSDKGVLTTKAVTGIKTVEVTVASMDGSDLESTGRITIYPATETISIYDGAANVTGTTVMLGVGETLDLWADSDPGDAMKDWVWSSNAPGYASVGANGLVTALTAGKTAAITAAATDGSGKKDYITVTVVVQM